MLPGFTGKYKLILASRSPRRQDLLHECGIEFDVEIVDYVESWPSKLIGKDIAEYLSGQKALQFRKRKIGEKEIIITADTIVWCSGKVLGKPSTEEMAIEILSEISGKTHEVITGVTLLSNSKEHTFSESTRVTFDVLGREEIEYYVRNYKPFDKAGAYGIQEWIGIVGNSRVEGSYFNVMGLPVNRLLKELKEFIGLIEK
jgi:septum formation protein